MLLKRRSGPAAASCLHSAWFLHATYFALFPSVLKVCMKHCQTFIVGRTDRLMAGSVTADLHLPMLHLPMCQSLLLLQVVTAQQALPQLQQQASDAAAQLQPSQAQERQQGQCFAQQAPQLLQVAAALLGPVRNYQVAAQEALPGVETMLEALKDVLGSMEV